MEQPGTYPFDEPAPRLNSFQLFHGTKNEECFTPVYDLPNSYRDEIDKGYTTGFANIDKYIQGIRRGELTIITADTGAGKTTFCTQLMVNLAMQSIPVWINSWEMKPAVIMRKLASIVLRRPMKYVNFNSHENEQFDEWATRYKVYINLNTIGTSIDALAKQLLAAKSLGIEIVMLDHLDYLVQVKSKEQLHEAIYETIKILHELAFSLGMHFFLICHPRQSGTGAEEVGMHSLKGSAALKQYADNIIVLHRCSRTDTTVEQNKVKVKIVKNRMFGTEGVTYLWYESAWDGYTYLLEG